MAHAPDRHEDRLAQLSLLYNLGQSLSAVLDLPELLAQVVEAAITLTQADEGIIALVDPETAEITVQASHEAGVSAPHLPGRAVEDPLAGAVILSGEPLLITAGDRTSVFGLAPPDQPSIYVPLINKGTPSGVLRVRNRPGGESFPPQYVEMLAGLAGYATIAIENARLYQQAVERNLELSLLVESSNAISSSLELGRVLNAIARHMMRGLDAHWCIITEWTPERTHSRKLAEYRLALWPPATGTHFSLETMPCHQRLLAQRQPLAIQASYDTASPEERACLTALSCQRMMVLPLQVKGSIIGLAEVSCLDTPTPFTPSQVGHSLRVALEMASLLDKQPLETRRASLFDSARRLLSTANADWCTIYLLDSTTNSLVRVLAYGAGIWPEATGPEIEISTLPTLGVVLREQRIAVLRSADPDLPPEERSLFETTGPSAMLALPLTFKGDTKGLAQLYNLDPNREFSSREMGLARALASQAAVALENARLVRDLQQSLAKQKVMQGQLVRAARLSALGELSAVVAHQINNPLTTILGDAEILVQDLPADDLNRESAMAILRAGQRAKKVVERMLIMTRVEVETQPQNINRTIEETLDLVGPQIAQQQIRLVVDLDSNIPPIQAIPGQLEDVWMNLLLNASDAILQKNAGDGCISVQSRLIDGGRTIEVQIEDNGIGIPEDQIDQLFDPFYTTKPRGKGTGLGLYVCRQAVMDLHGEIALDSVSGRGTRVTVRLPTIVPSKESSWHTS